MTEANLARLKTLVAAAYNGSKDSPDAWQRWCYENHVLIVAKLATLYGGNKIFCVAGSLLHDIADSILGREDPDHERRSEALARELLIKSGFSPESTELILRDVIAPHSCKNLIPETLEGKILATADAVAHLTSNFYSYLAWHHIDGGDYPGFKRWAQKKLEKDLNKKIFFEDVRKAMTINYKVLREVFCDAEEKPLSV
jgi:metal-dependent HD superfamily phosphatase/phosphodiesterase